MGSPTDTTPGYSQKEQDDLAHREAKNEAINSYNDSAGEAKKVDVPPRDSVTDAPAEVEDTGTATEQSPEDNDDQTPQVEPESAPEA